MTLTLKDGQSRDRVQEILTKIDVGGSEYEQAQLRSLLTKYIDIFALEDEDLGYTDKITHEIHLIDNEPVTQPYRRIPPNQYKEVKDHISQLLRKGVIQESNSAYASPIVLVRKADGSIRLCVDYRKLNQKIGKEKTPFLYRVLMRALMLCRGRVTSRQLI